MSKKSKKKQQARAGGASSVNLAALGWIAAIAAVAIGVGVFAYMVISSDSDSELGTVVTQTPDPRVQGLTPTVFLATDADDDGQAINPRFVPNQLSGAAGEVIEITLRNVGSVAHNLRVSGADKQYDTPDDWVSSVINPGDETKLVLKIDAAGSYPFRCDLHPVDQTGTLTLE